MGLEDPLEMALVGKTQRMGDHGQGLPFAQPPAGLLDALVDLPGVRGQACGASEGPDQLVAAHACQRCELLQGRGVFEPLAQNVHHRLHPLL